MYKIMIVDDEPVIRKYIISFIDWESLNCSVAFEACNGLEARDLINTNEMDVIIADIRMPGMDGIALSEYVYYHYPKIKVIILTAFADFSYAQSALRYGVVDFVIKTNPDAKLMEAVNKAKQIIEQQKDMEKRVKQLEGKISDSLYEMSEKLVKDIINGIITNPFDMSSKIKDLNLKIGHYFIVAFEIIGAFNENSTFSIKNFLSLALKEYCHYIAVMNSHFLIAVVSFDRSDEKAYINSVTASCNEIQNMVNSFMKFNISIGISRMHSSVPDMPQAYKEALEAVSWKFFSNAGISVYTSVKPKDISDLSAKTRMYIDQVAGFVAEGNGSCAIASLENLFEDLKAAREPVEKLKALSILLCSKCFSLPQSPGSSLQSAKENESDIYRKLQECQTYQDMNSIIRSVIKSISGLISTGSEKQNYLVREVNKFIKENYSSKVTLRFVAKQLHVNSSYLSRLYKKETGESVTDALNRYRIEKAKKLLENPANKIFEVAYSVGIDDPAYFTHVFGKYTGKSPSEYRS
ncbi:MAG: response regulator [Clostridiaceae bacterium]